MNTVTIVLSDDRLKELQQIATRFHVTPEELVRVSLEELLSRPEEDFRRALEYVLRKNTELYQRLA
ncbi:MAG: DNA-binding protein [Anaerolineales bacterium]